MLNKVNVIFSLVHSVPFSRLRVLISFDLLTHSNAVSSLRLKKNSTTAMMMKKKKTKKMFALSKTTANSAKYGVYAHLTHHKSAAFPVIE